MIHILLFTVVTQINIGLINTDTCSTRGKIPNDKSPDCRGYSICLPGAGNIFIQVDLFCPEEFIYSHIENQCTNITNYKCLSTYKCTNVGNFINPLDPDCTSYITCIKGLNENDVIDARIIQCPLNTIFDPDKGSCVNDINICNNVIEENTSKVKLEKAAHSTKCTVAGTFPNNKQPDCRGYTNCLPGLEQPWVDSELICPISYIYNHIDLKCTNATSYKCLSSYNCTSLGNFKNPYSADCNSYIACIRGLNDNDIMTARLIRCPHNTTFDDDAGVCVYGKDFSCDNKPKVKEIKLNSSVDLAYSEATKIRSCCIIFVLLSVLYY